MERSHVEDRRPEATACKRQSGKADHTPGGVSSEEAKQLLQTVKELPLPFLGVHLTDNSLL